MLKNQQGLKKIRIKALGLNCNNWLVVRDDIKLFIIEHRHTGTVKSFGREEGK